MSTLAQTAQRFRDVQEAVKIFTTLWELECYERYLRAFDRLQADIQQADSPCRPSLNHRITR